MAVVPILDLDDPRIAVYRSLKVTNQTRRSNHFVVEGKRLVARLLASRFPVASVLVTDRQLPQLGEKLPDTAPVYVVRHEQIASIVGFPFHRGVLACGRREPWPELEELLAGHDRGLFVVICPKLSNPENLGAIARIGDVFGVDAVLAGPACPDPFSRRVLRVSMGAVLRIPVLIDRDLGKRAGELARSGRLELVAAVADPFAQPFGRVERPRRVGLVLGDEHDGVDAEWLGRCSQTITIPMRPGASSLNVAVAAGILICHWSRDAPGSSHPAPGTGPEPPVNRPA
jgi:tRNA G18 (ribose-2'-O)-methylase SpoU